MRWEEARYQDPTLRLAGGAAEYAKAAGREGGRVTPTKCLQPRGNERKGRWAEEEGAGEGGRQRRVRAEPAKERDQEELKEGSGMEGRYTKHDWFTWYS